MTILSPSTSSTAIVQEFHLHGQAQWNDLDMTKKGLPVLTFRYLLLLFLLLALFFQLTDFCHCLVFY